MADQPEWEASYAGCRADVGRLDQLFATECVYQPKQKPGLKPGAVEALTRRVAFLEQILLDNAGNIRPQYLHDEVAQNDRGSHHENGGEVVLQVQENFHYSDTPSDYRQDANGSTNTDSQPHRQEKPSTNPLKRKLDEPLLGDWLVTLIMVKLKKPGH
ncbi:hypothetical protein N0V83_004435 [Neocucurbitaria cava]|uniref:Uncharacterized protein n=1 Tax=Neocucurbitaria cava TaxID=798079 RepID=A0A9W9CMH4_9PLEO|nr:hypothetical protein N0V83_004435 [Neocucurbitaria cava]